MRQRSGNKDDIIQDLETKNSALEQNIVVLKKKLEQRIESETSLRKQHTQLHKDHSEMTNLAEKRLADATAVENKFSDKIVKLDGELMNTKSILQRTKAANEVAMKSVSEEKE